MIGICSDRCAPGSNLSPTGNSSDWCVPGSNRSPTGNSSDRCVPASNRNLAGNSSVRCLGRSALYLRARGRSRGAPDFCRMNFCCRDLRYSASSWEEALFLNLFFQSILCRLSYLIGKIVNELMQFLKELRAQLRICRNVLLFGRRSDHRFRRTDGFRGGNRGLTGRLSRMG